MGTIRKNRRSFTLIELLVVVALTAVLLGLGIPAFSRMMRGNKVEECSSRIKLALEQAQLRAASERRYVAVIFPNGDDGDVSESFRKYRLGGFRLAYVKKHSARQKDASGASSGSGYTFVRWLDSDWKNAPDGAILTRIDTSEFSKSSNGDVDDCTEKITDDLEGSGKLNSISSIKDEEDNSIKLGDNCAVIFTPYGSTVGGSKLFFLISEALVNGDTIIYPSAATAGTNRTANYLVLKLNNLTGRVEYHNND